MYRRQAVQVALLALSVFVTSQVSAHASIDAFIPRKISGVEQPMPPYFSGTNCSISWEVVSLPNINRITHVKVWINGYLVRDDVQDPDIGTNPYLTGDIRFDSTFIPDNT